MREYLLHTASWSRIVAHRIAEPAGVAERLTSRRRRDNFVLPDGHLVLLSCNHRIDPRTGTPVSRRELLDRIVEALSVPEVDGVVASADLLEELTLLNVLERRLAFCHTSSYGPSAGVGLSAVAASNFDGAVLAHHWKNGGPSDPVMAEVAELAALDMPSLIEVFVNAENGIPEVEATWSDWIEPVTATAASCATGSGVWISIPAVNGLTHLAESVGFPILIRDADVPIEPESWRSFFGSALPTTMRGMLPGVSALFPLTGSVVDATSSIAQAIRSRSA